MTHRVFNQIVTDLADGECTCSIIELLSPVMNVIIDSIFHNFCEFVTFTCCLLALLVRHCKWSIFCNSLHGI